MYKKLIFKSVTAVLFTAAALSAEAQSDIIGKVDYDGITQLSVSETHAKQVLKNLSLPTEAQPFEATDILITEMDDGSYSLTGYIRNPAGIVIKGFRVQCNQDDSNNLIVKAGNRKERITGKPF